LILSLKISSFRFFQTHSLKGAAVYTVRNTAAFDPEAFSYIEIIITLCGECDIRVLFITPPQVTANRTQTHHNPASAFGFEANLKLA
jgi:hypothetical protein